MDSHERFRGLALPTAIAVMLGTAWNASAAPITWQLEGVTFDDGGLATGTFTTDSGVLTSWDILTSGGKVLPALTYDTLDSDAYGPLPDVHFMTLDSVRYLRLHFAASLSNPGTDPLLTSPIFTSYECGNSPTCSNIREVTAGEAIAGGVTAGEVVSVPEPPVAALFGAGLLGLGFIRRRSAAQA